MRTVAALIALLAAGGVHAAGSVEVSFVKPEAFADARDRAHRLEDNLEALRRMVVATAAPYVASGQTLKIEVLDVDLAGEPKPGARVSDVRVLRGGADWPRIALRWRLEAAGAQARGGEAVLQDMTYLQRIQPALSDTRLVYERRMLDDWLRAQFGKPVS
jgi:hypothetical protein